MHYNFSDETAWFGDQFMLCTVLVCTRWPRVVLVFLADSRPGNTQRVSQTEIIQDGYTNNADTEIVQDGYNNPVDTEIAPDGYTSLSDTEIVQDGYTNNADTEIAQDGYTNPADT